MDLKALANAVLNRQHTANDAAKAVRNGESGDAKNVAKIDAGNLVPIVEEKAESIARLDRERNERDRLAKRGYDFDETAPSHPKFEPASWRQHGVFNSRSPLIPPAIRVKIETIEAEARAAGWPAERLWNAAFWDSPRGLAAILDVADEIGEVTADYIEILKTKRDLTRFYRRQA